MFSSRKSRFRTRAFRCCSLKAISTSLNTIPGTAMEAKEAGFESRRDRTKRDGRHDSAGVECDHGAGEFTDSVCCGLCVAKASA